MVILTVAEATGYIKEVLAADQLLADLWLYGELSNLSRSAGGHQFFTLKDDAGQLRCVLFRHQAQFQLYQPTNGDQVVVHGQVSLYESSGSLQLYVDLIQPAGVGAAHLEFERRRQQLAEQGLFDESRKRPLPPYPRCIGVVTSAQGAVWHDIQQVIARRYPLVELVLAPAQVQGEAAPASIVRALQRLWGLERCEVIIVGRGGGSTEDLAAFNDERVARAIYASPVPIISAVGHEINVTIADFVADRRAPTPSAAAELAVPDRAALLDEVLNLRHRLRTQLIVQVDQERTALEHAAARLQRAAPHATLQTSRRELDRAMRTLARRLRADLDRRRQLVAAEARRLTALDPLAVLGRGYAVVTRADDGTVVGGIDGLAVGDTLQVQVSDGRFAAVVAADEEQA